MAINWGELTPEEVLEKAQELEQQATKAENDVEVLSTKKTELLIEKKKLGKVATFLRTLGIDTRAKDFDEKVADLVVKLESFNEPIESDSGEPAQPSQANQQKNNQQPLTDLNPEIRQMFERMQKQVESLTTKLSKAEEEVRKKDETMKAAKVKNTVIEKLIGSGLSKKRAEHLFRLTQDKYRLTKDGNDVIGGDEYEPISLDVIVGNMRDSDEFGDYFPGSGNSGSGYHGSQNSAPPVSMASNPFAVGSVNATEAARLMQENPARGKQMLLQAQQAGKLDPVMKTAFLK